MYKWDKPLREEKSRQERKKKKPSFSSTLLDEIYRTIDENPLQDSKFHTDPTQKNLKNYISNEFKRKSYQDHESMFSSTSNSSDSSSTNSSIYSNIARSSWFDPPPRSNIIQPNDSGRFTRNTDYAMFYKNRGIPAKDKTDYALFNKNREIQLFSTNRYNPKSTSIKNFRKLKLPISPGGRIVNFINSLFKSSKKSNTKSQNVFTEKIREFKTEPICTTCSSASPYSRSCLNKNSVPRDKRSVRFSPVSVIVDDDDDYYKSFGHKTLYPEQEEDFNLMPMSLPSSWISSNEFHLSKNRSEMGTRDHRSDHHKVDEDEDDEDAVSCSSSDLFEIDHENYRYFEELPVYETTHFGSLVL